jgi:hypothetical protein
MAANTCSVAIGIKMFTSAKIRYHKDIMIMIMIMIVIISIKLLCEA